MIERIEHEGKLIALIIPGEHSEPGIQFFTEDDFSQQLAFMCRPAGQVIGAHTHNLVQRQVQLTQEVLFIRKGRLRVDFYDGNCSYLESRELGAGDVIFLASGGHGFEVLEEVEMIEVKQGPYVGAQDKVHFSSVPTDRIRLKN
jgi:hypothetical protein